MSSKSLWLMVVANSNSPILRHLAGKHNQKTHANKYGSRQDIKQSLRRLSGDKQDRERYKNRVRAKVELNKLLTKDVGIIKTVGDKIHLKTPYNADFVNDLRNNIPSANKKWDAGSKTWIIDKIREKEARTAMERHWNVANQDKIGVEGVKTLQQKTTFTRVKKSQSYVRKNRDRIQAEIDSLNDVISSYSFSSRNSRKQEAITNRALLEFSIKDSKGDPAKMEGIQQRGLAAAVRYMERH